MTRIKFVACLFVLLVSVPAYALNGIQVIGVGAIHRSLGGAGVARPLDSTAILLNPSGMGDVGRRFDLSFTVGFPKTSMDATPVSAMGGGNAAESNDEAAILPNVGLIIPVNDKWALGLGVFTTSGFGVDYNSSRFAAAAGAYDRSSRYGLMKFIPAVSYKILDNLSVGAGVHINYAFLQTDLATAPPALTQTTGLGRYDPSVGLGGSIGVIYEPLSWLSVGTVYMTRQYFRNFGRYMDLLLDSVDMPQQVSAGVAVTPPDPLKVLKGALLVADFKWIDWDRVGTLGASPAVGGFGWRDQYVVGAGIQYGLKERIDFLPLTLRAGYNYGRSVVPPSAALANILVPGIYEHHLTCGLGYEITDRISVHGSYTRFFENTVTDNALIVTFAGASSLTSSAHVFTTQLNVGF